MECLLGCFGGRKKHKRRINRRITQRQGSHVQNAPSESITTAEQPTPKATSVYFDHELRNKLEGVEQVSPSPKKRVTFNSNIKTYEHVPIRESIESQPYCATNAEKQNPEDLKTSHLSSEGVNSVIPCFTSYPPNHRYHNARESDDEDDEYIDSDLDDMDDLSSEDQYDDEFDERNVAEEVWPESMESTAQVINEDVESPMLINGFGSRSDSVSSVLNPIENVTQWKAAKSKRSYQTKQQKENSTSEPTSLKKTSDQVKNLKQEIAVDASLSKWLVSSEIKKTSFGSQSRKTTPEGHTSLGSYDDRPIFRCFDSKQT